MPPEVINTKTFFTEKPALTISPPREWGMKGHIDEIDGRKVLVGEHIIQFIPMGRGGAEVRDAAGRLVGVRHFGNYTTSDPKEIEYLTWRAENVGDVFGSEKYEELATPPERRIQELTRQLLEKNRLIDTLNKQGKQPNPAAR